MHMNGPQKHRNIMFSYTEKGFREIQGKNSGTRRWTGQKNDNIPIRKRTAEKQEQKNLYMGMGRRLKQGHKYSAWGPIAQRNKKNNNNI